MDKTSVSDVYLDLIRTPGRISCVPFGVRINRCKTIAWRVRYNSYIGANILNVYFTRVKRKMG